MDLITILCKERGQYKKVQFVNLKTFHIFWYNATNIVK